MGIQDALSSSRLRLEVAAGDHAHQAGCRRDQKVAKKAPALATEGAIAFLERVSPALEHVDSSSGSIGFLKTLVAPLRALILSQQRN